MFLRIVTESSESLKKSPRIHFFSSCVAPSSVLKDFFKKNYNPSHTGTLVKYKKNGSLEKQNEIF